MVLTTRDRPRFLAAALACYGHQSYPCRELIVVDDGDAYPAGHAAVEAAGGRLLRAEPGTSIGAKLNCGLEQASGVWCQKMDDDDWYAPNFIENMVAAVMAQRREVCRPVVAFLAPFLFFDVASWRVRRSVPNNVPGATLFFAREDWRNRPFRELMNDEDLWFLLDQVHNGASALPVRALESFLAVRHRTAARDRGHTWVHQADGRTLERYLDERPLYRTPEQLLPEWALSLYRDLREELPRAC